MNIQFHNEVSIPLGKFALKGELFIPREASAIIIFSHGSGSSRLNKRNRMVAKHMQGLNFGTLLFDLLTEEEDLHYSNRFDIELLTKRLAGATEWLESHSAAKDCRIGYFGAGVGTAAALKAAAVLPNISAIVSRGGRPDLASGSLKYVDAPTLLIVGSLDHETFQLNQEAYSQLKCEKKLQIIPGATHLFEEYGTIEKVCESSGNWFEKYFQQVTA